MRENMRFPSFETEAGQEGRFETHNNVERGPHKNTELLISITRHGEKTPEGKLTEKGFKQAEAKGQSREIVGNVVKGYHSPEFRTKQMVDAEIVAIPETISGQELKKYDSRMRQQLDYNPLSKATMAEWKNQGGKAVEWYYQNYHDQAMDGDSISAGDMANRTANLVYRHIRMAGRLKDGSRANLEYASHTPTLDMFVADAFKDQIEKDPMKPDGTNTIQKMGGGFKEAEEFQIRAKTDTTGMLSATFSFRDKEYQVDLEKLKTMSEAWLEKQKAFEKEE